MESWSFTGSGAFAVINIVGIFKSFSIKEALKDVSFNLKEKEALAIVGPSGCGKTTLLRILAGLEKPDSGEVKIGGRVMSSRTYMASPSMRGISMIFQDLALWPHMTAQQNIAFVLHHKGLSRSLVKERIEEALEQVGLQDCLKRYPHQLSGGERQRLALARGLAPRPDYLLMDEPMSSLDPILRDDLLVLINHLRTIHNMGMVLCQPSYGRSPGLGRTNDLYESGPDRSGWVREGDLEPWNSPRGKKIREDP